MTSLGMSHDTVENDHEEPEESALGVKLGVRPTWFYSDHHNHPETRRCPAWCDSAEEPWSHEIDPDHPIISDHTLGVPVETAASLYLGERDQVPRRMGHPHGQPADHLDAAGHR